MLPKARAFILNTALTTLSTFALASTAAAQYGQYIPHIPVPAGFQQAGYQHNFIQNNSFNALPEVLPYIPFNTEPQLANPVYDAPQVTLQRNYQARPVSYQQVAPRQSLHTGYLSAERQRIITEAKRHLGIKYRWGGNTPREGFDCSGFTKYALKTTGASIPRTAAQQSKASRTISRRDLKPGDLIFFKTKGRSVNHVGIYLGNGRFIHAASGGGKVTTDDLRKSYWQKRLHKYGTFLS